MKQEKEKVDKEINWNSVLFKVHGITGIMMGFFILWMAITGIILAHREPIREMSHTFDTYEPPEYHLGFAGKAILINAALDIGWAALGYQEEYSRIEMKWENGAPIYRIRFKDAGKSEVTIH